MSTGKREIEKGERLNEQLREKVQRVRERTDSLVDRYSQNDPIEQVLGLKTRDHVLLVGDGIIFPSVKKSVSSLSLAKKSRDIDAMERLGRTFDRIFISKNTLLTEMTVRKAVAIMAQDGLICFFSESEELRGAFLEIIERNWPQADSWVFESNVGPVVVTNANGSTQWQS